MFNAGAVLLTDTGNRNFNDINLILEFEICYFLYYFLAYLRGHMEKCFHRQCDDYENIQEPQNSLKFLSEVTQALVLTVFELTMPQGSTCSVGVKLDDVNDELTTELEEIVNNGIEDRVDTNLVVDEDDDIGNEQLTSEVPSIPIKTHQMNMRHYQPYFQGTQINVETLNIINDELLTKSLLERLLYKKRKNSPMILSVKTEELWGFVNWMSHVASLREYVIFCTFTSFTNIYFQRHILSNTSKKSWWNINLINEWNEIDDKKSNTNYKQTYISNWVQINRIHLLYLKAIFYLSLLVGQLKFSSYLPIWNHIILNKLIIQLPTKVVKVFAIDKKFVEFAC